MICVKLFLIYMRMTISRVRYPIDVKAVDFRSQLEASLVSSHTEKL